MTVPLIDNLIERKSCFFNLNSSKCKLSQGSKVFYCVGEGINTRNSSLSSINQKFLECNNSITVTDIYTNDFPEYDLIGVSSPRGYSAINTLTYNLKDASDLQIKGCKLCGSNLLSSCPGALRSECNINLSAKTCIFGSNSNTNCAAPISVTEGKKKEGSFTYFCASGNKVVQCDGDKTGSSYSDILESNFTQIKSGSGCRFYSSSSGTESCKLKSSPTTDNTCKFGPLTTQNSTSNPLYKSCPDDSSEGTNTINGRFIYCSPNNVKVSCTSRTDYKTLFNPVELTDGTTGLLYYDYSSRRTLTDRAKNNHGCELVSTTIAPTPGCSINTSSQVGDECTIPKDCYNSSSQPTRIDLGGTDGVGGLYCINRGIYADDFKENVGTVYFCKATLTGSSYTLKPYSRISEITTKNGIENVYFVSGGSTSCSNSPSININVKYRELDPLSPLGLIRSASTFLYYFAIFYFIVLMLTNAFAYVRSGEDPAALKKIKESLFNTIAGFLFVLLSGGVIVYLINQFTP